MDFIEMTMRPDFEKAIRKLREKWKIDTDLTSSDSKEGENEWLRLMENPKIDPDVKLALSDLGLSTGWQDVVRQYLVDGNNFPYNSKSEEIIRNYDGFSVEINSENTNDIILRVGPETKFDDLKTAWKEIKKRRPKLLSRDRKRNNFLRDYYIFHFAQDGKTLNEIYKQMLKLGHDVDYGNIKKIVSSFYDRLKITKKDRIKLRTS